MSQLRRGQSPPPREANHPRHLIEVEALAALDHSLVVVMLPWGQHEQAPLSAGIKTAASRLGKGRKAVFLKHDNRKAMLECSLHHSLLTRTNARRDKNCPVLGM